jgi:hypothetical protein
MIGPIARRRARERGPAGSEWFHKFGGIGFVAGPRVRPEQSERLYLRSRTPQHPRQDKDVRQKSKLWSNLALSTGAFFISAARRGALTECHAARRFSRTFSSDSNYRSDNSPSNVALSSALRTGFVSKARDWSAGGNTVLL